MSRYTFELDDFAEEEFYNTVNYYKQYDRSLSADFIHEFDQAVQQLIAFPEAGTTYLHQTRRVFLDRFPYAIIYKIYPDNTIVAHAVTHLKRKPDYWTNRL